MKWPHTHRLTFNCAEAIEALAFQLNVSRSSVVELAIDHFKSTHKGFNSIHQAAESGTGDAAVLAYVAGIFDGEGSVAIGHRKVGGRRYHQLAVTVANTHEPTIRHLSSLFAGNTLILNKKRKDARRACHRWSAQSNNAAAFLEAVRPYLHIKRLQAEIGLVFQKEMYARSRCRSNQLTEEEITRRHDMREAVMSLNQSKGLWLPLRAGQSSRAKFRRERARLKWLLTHLLPDRRDLWGHLFESRRLDTGS